MRRSDLGEMLTFERRNRIKHAIAPAIAPSLPALGWLYQSDKRTTEHGYVRTYERHFRPRRRRVRSVFEIGVFRGQSLRMWRDYFPHAHVLGLDLDPDTMLHDEPRITTVTGDQTDQQLLTELAAEHGPFDIVVDDGSHLQGHAQASFEALFPHVAPQGIYVIEDLHTCYWPDYGGGPPGHPGTTMEVLRGLLDETQGRSLGAIHLYSDIVFIEKARAGVTFTMRDFRPDDPSTHKHAGRA